MASRTRTVYKTGITVDGVKLGSLNEAARYLGVDKRKIETRAYTAPGSFTIMSPVFGRLCVVEYIYEDLSPDEPVNSSYRMAVLLERQEKVRSGGGLLARVETRR